MKRDRILYILLSIGAIGALSDQNFDASASVVRIGVRSSK